MRSIELRPRFMHVILRLIKRLNVISWASKLKIILLSHLQSFACVERLLFYFYHFYVTSLIATLSHLLQVVNIQMNKRRVILATHSVCAIANNKQSQL